MRGCGPFEPQPRLVVGCSGGPDSLALTLLLNQWCQRHGGALLAVVVDHRLRPNSDIEAQTVQNLLQAHGINSRIMVWAHDGVTHAIQERARLARRDLLTVAAVEFGALHVALAHHRDDQLETVTMRAERDSYWPGWAGMAPVRAAGAVQVIRPLLSVTKDELIAACRAFGVAWVEDPGNLSDRFRRGLIRQRRSVWGRNGLDQAVLALSDQASHWRGAWAQAMALAALSVSVDAAGIWHVGPDILAHDVWPDCLARVIAAASGASWPVGLGYLAPHLDAVRRLMTDSGAPGAPGAMTLAGAVIRPARAMAGGGLWIFREYDGVAGKKIAASHDMLHWDGRFLLKLTAGAGGMWQALGPAGVRQLMPILPPEKQALPKAALWAQPGLRQGDDYVLAPSLGIVAKADMRAFCRYQSQTSVADVHFRVGE